MAKFLDDKTVADLVYNDVRWARDYRQNYRDKWERFYALYKNFINRANYPYKARLAIPSAFSVTEVQVSFLIDMIMEAGDFIEVLGKTPQGQVSASAVKQMLNYHFTHSIRTYEEMEKFIRQLLIFGTSVFKVYWNYRPGWKTRMIPEYVNNDLAEYKSVLTAEVLENQPDGYTVDLWNFGIDPNGNDCDSARFAFEEMWVDPITLVEKQQIGIYKNVDQLGPTSKTNEGLQMRLDTIDHVSWQDSPYVEREKIHIIDYWGYITKGWKDGKLSKQAKSQLYHVVMALSSSTSGGDGAPVVLLAEPSPFHHNRIPFVDAALNRCVGEFYGVGDIEYCESLFYEERDLRNIALDNLNLSMNQMFKMRKGSDIDESELVSAPGQIIRVPQMDDLEVMQFKPIDPGNFQTQESIRRDIETVTGVNDFVMGQYRSSTGFNDTATGISLIQQMALKRIAHKGQIVQRMIRDVGHMVFTLVAQYQPWGTSVRILDRESATQYRFLDISPEALAQAYDFHIVNAPSIGSRDVQQNQLIQILQILMAAKQDAGVQFDWMRFIKGLMELMGIPNSSRFFGFQDFNTPLNDQLGSPSPTEELIPPEEENRLMVEQRMVVYPKLEENHPHHMIVHGEVYDNTQDPEAKHLLEEHYKLHQQLAEQSKALLATALSTQMAAEQAQEQMRQANLTTGNTRRSPTGAGGREDLMRGLGNMMGGNG